MPCLHLAALPGVQAAAGVPESTVVSGAEGLLEGCHEQLQALAPAALDNPDLPASMLVNGCLQRYILM